MFQRVAWTKSISEQDHPTDHLTMISWNVRNGVLGHQPEIRLVAFWQLSTICALAMPCLARLSVIRLHRACHIMHIIQYTANRGR